MGGSRESNGEYEKIFNGVRYLGSVGINRSLLPYPGEHRELIVSAAIYKLFKEADLDVQPTPILNEVDQLPYSRLNEILGSLKVASNPRSRARTRVTTRNIEISVLQTQSNGGYFQDIRDTVAQHRMDAISFASLDLSHYVSYVAKETDDDGVAIDDSRACHVIECESPKQANEIYAAVEYAFNQRAREPIKPMVIPEKAFGTLSGKNWDDTIPQGVEPSYYNTDPNKVPPESGLRRQPMPGQVLYANQEVIDDMVNSPPANARPPKPIRARRSTDKNYVNQDVVDEHNRKTRNSSTDSNETIGTPTTNIRASTSSTSSMSSLSSFTPQPGESDQHRRLREIVSEARGLEYFHSFSSNPRKAVDEKLKEDGDFLLREASIFLIPNQIRNITLSVLNTIKGKAVIKHVLLIMSPKEDTENPIHTRDKSFSSISELIDYYMEDQRILQMPRDNPDSEEGNIKISNPIKRNLFIDRERAPMNDYTVLPSQRV